MDNELRKLQLVELELLDEFVRICDKYNLTYYLAYGTLLGAVRHKGFIPWDDDLDVVMPQQDYVTFCNVVRKEVDSIRFTFQDTNDKNNPLFSAKLRRNGTIYTSKKLLRLKMEHYGCWIDIFRMDNVNNPKSILFWGQYLFHYLNPVIFHRALIDLNGLSFARKFVHYCSCILSLKQWNDLRDKVFMACKNNESKYIAVFGTPYSPKKEIRLRKAFGIPNKIEFEGKMYNAPADYDYVLKCSYGDYMKLPPIESRQPSHFADVWEI